MQKNFADFNFFFFFLDFSSQDPLCIYSVCFLFEFVFPHQHPVVSLPKRSCLSCLVSLVSLDLPLCVYIASSLHVLFLKSCTCFSCTSELCFPRIFLHVYFFFLIRNSRLLICLFSFLVHSNVLQFLRLFKKNLCLSFQIYESGVTFDKHALMSLTSPLNVSEISLSKETL